MRAPVVGILGLGYLGQELFRVISWKKNSWATKAEKFSSSTFSSHFRLITFRWENSSTWNNLPPEPVPILLTIPPVYQERAREENRLRDWCEWMLANRSYCRQLVYISSTGVYPNKNGWWNEDSTFTPDTLKGHLRLDTEKILAKYFQLRVIRPGAIYGPNRNIGYRIHLQKLIPQGNQPVHRIHVSDLAHIVKLAITENSLPAVINAVDLDPSSSKTVTQWLLQQNFFKLPAKQNINFFKGPVSRKQQVENTERKISNRQLLQRYKYQFLYPTYQEGLKQALAQ